jgi:hypothetical protein
MSIGPNSRPFWSMSFGCSRTICSFFVRFVTLKCTKTKRPSDFFVSSEKSLVGLIVSPALRASRMIHSESSSVTVLSMRTTSSCSFRGGGGATTLGALWVGAGSGVIETLCVAGGAPHASKNEKRTCLRMRRDCTLAR